MPNKMERFTNHARYILSLTQDATEEFGVCVIKPAHLMLAMTRAEDTDAQLILNEFDIISSKLAPFVKAKQIPILQSDNERAQMELSPEIKQILDLSVEIATQRRDHFIGTVHLVIGLMRCSMDEINAILEHFDVQANDIIKLADSYLDEDQNLEAELNETQLPRYQRIKSLTLTTATSALDTFRRIFRLTDKRKNDG